MLSPQDILKACRVWTKQRYDAFDAVSKAELEAAAKEAKAEVCGKKTDDQICDNIPVRDTPKAAQLKVIGKVQTDITSLSKQTLELSSGRIYRLRPHGQ